MSSYQYTDDGKVHTRYSELLGCTPSGVQLVAARHLAGAASFENEATLWGTTRHKKWQAEALTTSKVPECFADSLPDVRLTHIEEEFKTEFWPGRVIIHSRPDAIAANDGILIDYKTIVAETLPEGIGKATGAYSRSKQLPFYGYVLGLHNVRIQRIIYLIEVWNPERDTILGYGKVDRRLTLAEVAKIIPWVNYRVALLVGELERQTA